MNPDQIAVEAASVIAGTLNLDEKQQPGLKRIILAAIEKAYLTFAEKTSSDLKLVAAHASDDEFGGISPETTRKIREARTKARQVQIDADARRLAAHASELCQECGNPHISGTYGHKFVPQQDRGYMLQVEQSSDTKRLDWWFEQFKRIGIDVDRQQLDEAMKQSK